MDSQDVVDDAADIFARQHSEWVRQWTSYLDQNSPSVLCHYTTVDGLTGILETRRFWATHAEYLNDKTELRYAIELVRKRLQARAEKEKGELFFFLQYAMHNFNLFESKLDVYVSCFCEDEDLLSQWRAYGASGGGYAVCVSPTLPPEEISVDRPAQIFLRKVVYDMMEQEFFIDEAISCVCRALKEVRKTSSAVSDIEMTQKFVGNFRGLMLDCMWCFKDAAFSTEREWRFGHVRRRDDLSEVKFRSVKGALIPYVTLDLSSMYTKGRGLIRISKIVHGPTLEPILTERSLQWLLARLGYTDTTVGGSKVPLRV